MREQRAVNRKALTEAVRTGRWSEACAAAREGTPLATGKWAENALAIALGEGGLARASDAGALLEAEAAFVGAHAGTRGTDAARERDPQSGRGLVEAVIDAAVRGRIEDGEAQALTSVLIAHGAQAGVGCASEAGARGAGVGLANALIESHSAAGAREEAGQGALEEALAHGHAELAQALMQRCESARMGERTVRRALGAPRTGLAALARVLASEAVSRDDVARMDREGPLTLVALVCEQPPEPALERLAVQIIETLRRKGADIGGARTGSDPLGTCLRKRWSAGVDAVMAWQSAPRGAPFALELARHPPRGTPESKADVGRWLARAVRTTGAQAQRASDPRTGRSCLTEAAANDDAKWLLGPMIEALGDPDARDARGRTALGECARLATEWARAGERARALGAGCCAERSKEEAQCAQARALVAMGADPWTRGEDGRSAAQLGAGSMKMLAALGVEPGRLKEGRGRRLAHAACEAAQRGAPGTASETLRWMAEAGCAQALEDSVLKRLRNAWGADARARYARERDSATTRIAALCDPDKATVEIDAWGVRAGALHPLGWSAETGAGASVDERARTALAGAPAGEHARLANARVWIASEGTDPGLLAALEDALA